MVAETELHGSRRMRAIERVLERVEYSLSFCRAPRKFTASGLTGPLDEVGGLIDDAHSDGATSGAWCHDFDAPRPDEEDALVQTAFEIVVAEAVHEVCEWFRVDGRMLVDPHGSQQIPVFDISVHAARAIWELTRPSMTTEVDA